MWLTPHFPDLCWVTCIYTYTPPVAPAYPVDRFICAHSGVRREWWQKKHLKHSLWVRNRQCLQVNWYQRQVLCNQLPSYMVMITGRCGKWRRVAKLMHIMNHRQTDHTTTPPCLLHRTTPHLSCGHLEQTVNTNGVMLYYNSNITHRNIWEWFATLFDNCEKKMPVEPLFSLPHAMLSSTTNGVENIRINVTTLTLAVRAFFIFK